MIWPTRAALAGAWWSRLATQHLVLAPGVVGESGEVVGTEFELGIVSVGQQREVERQLAREDLPGKRRLARFGLESGADGVVVVVVSRRGR